MPRRKKTTPPRVAQRVLIDGLTADQDEVLRTVQYRTGMLVGHDTLYLAGRPGVAGAETESAVRQPTKRQVNSWLKGEKGFQRQKTSGAALPKHKPVAIIRRSRPVQYVQFDAFQLPERELPIRVTYKNKNRNRVSVPLVNKYNKYNRNKPCKLLYALIMVDVFSKYVWVRLLQTPKGAGISRARR